MDEGWVYPAFLCFDPTNRLLYRLGRPVLTTAVCLVLLVQLGHIHRGLCTWQRHMKPQPCTSQIYTSLLEGLTTVRHGSYRAISFLPTQSTKDLGTCTNPIQLTPQKEQHFQHCPSIPRGKTNMNPENHWFVEEDRLPKVPFQGPCWHMSAFRRLLYGC